MEVTFTWVFVVIVAAMCVSSALTVPGGFYTSDIDGHKMGEAVISKTPEYRTSVICFSISLSLCIGVAAVHTLVERVDEDMWRVVVQVTKVLSWIAGFLAVVGLMQYVLLSLGDQIGYKQAIEAIFYGVLGSAFAVIGLLLYWKPNTADQAR